MISIDEKKCTLCGLCIPVCVRRILQKGEKSVNVTDPAMCLACGHCKAVCPTNAPQYSHGNEEFVPVPSKKETPSAAVLFRFFRNRRSLRVYQETPVEEVKLKMIIEAGRYAPTGTNRQACEYVVVNGRKMLDRICDIAIAKLHAQGKEVRKTIEECEKSGKPIPEELARFATLPAVWERIALKWQEGGDQLLHNAPALVIVHMKNNLATTPELDAAIAATQMVLLAETMGLGTCYIGFLIWAIENSPELKSMLGIPADNRSLICFTVGYPNVEYLRFVSRNPAKVHWVGKE